MNYRGNILVVSSPNLTPGLRSQLESYMRKAQLPMMQLRFVTDLTKGFLKKQGRRAVGADMERRDEFLEALRKAVQKYAATCIVINDLAALQLFTQKRHTLDQARGGVYFFDKLPVVVLDSLRTETGMAKLKAVPHAGWLLQQDCKKLKRWYEGSQKREPRFDYKVVSTVSEARELVALGERSLLIGMDLETTGSGPSSIITCSGYSLLQPDGSVVCRVVPFVNPMAGDGCHWSSDNFAEVLRCLRTLHANATPKIMQNGSYDCHYYVRYRMPPNMYTLDTGVMFHSIWPEIPKKLYFITSIASDYYRFWKDEMTAGEAAAKEDTKVSRLPQTAEGWQRYLRYNAMDCHALIQDTLWLLRVITQVPWALRNYREMMRQTLGPALAMSLRGVLVNEKLQSALHLTHQQESEKALDELRRMAADATFNPNSPAQVATLLYDVYKATPLPKRGAKKKTATAGNRSTDEKVLEIIRTQHPLLDRIITQIWSVKKPANNVAKYGVLTWENGKPKGLQLWNRRWLYRQNATGTETGRYASKKSDFWLGQQIQNVPAVVRPIVEPDPGYVLFKADLSKADFWHTAYASMEPEMLRVLSLPDYDLHCGHAAKFFSKTYEEVYAGYKAKEPWVVDSLRGVRQNAKRIVYGANYLMAGYTLFLTMGKEAVEATARFMGHDTKHWSVKAYADFCQGLLNFYFSSMYPQLMPWLERTLQQSARNGSLAVCCGGRTRTFFRDLMNDNAAQREFAAFFGQGGTASTINRALDKIYYEGIDSKELMILFQVHDDITGQVREDCVNTHIPLLKQAMELENEMHGQKFTIPVDIEVGYGWGARMTEWYPGITLEEIRAADAKWREKNPQLARLME